MRDSAGIAVRIGSTVSATVILLLPAIWNGFPILEWDTGGYLARWFEGYLVPSRSTTYGLFSLPDGHSTSGRSCCCRLLLQSG
jgi:hypothetical protein